MGLLVYFQRHHFPSDTVVHIVKNLSLNQVIAIGSANQSDQEQVILSIVLTMRLTKTLNCFLVNLRLYLGYFHCAGGVQFLSSQCNTWQRRRPT